MSNNPSQVIKLFGKTIIQQVDNTQSNSAHTTSSSSSTTTSLEADQETSTGMEKAGGGGSSKLAVISCPRCKSKETKFCYFNYNVNQPRHFCKSCRMYWTAGGTLRTVPVGAGRRKNQAPHPDGELGSTCLALDQDIH